MAKKRLIFALLFEDGYFIQSRNFRRQRVGDVHWLKESYGFQPLAEAVDELFLFDISESADSKPSFIDACEYIASEFFAPIAVGGRIDSLDTARQAVSIGAEKVVVNTALERDPGLIEKLAEVYGQQAIVASVDVRCVDGEYRAYVTDGSEEVPRSAIDHLEYVTSLPVGEILLSSIDRDGTGMGLDMDLLDLVPRDVQKPLVLMGGAGSFQHLVEPLSSPRLSGAATANLFNFVGDGLQRARAQLLESGVPLARWRLDAEGDSA